MSAARSDYRRDRYEAVRERRSRDRWRRASLDYSRALRIYRPLRIFRARRIARALLMTCERESDQQRVWPYDAWRSAIGSPAKTGRIARVGAGTVQKLRIE